MKTVQLGELCNFINGDRGKNYPSQSSFISDGIPFINAGDLEDKIVSIRSLNYISENDYNKLNSGKVELNDILFCLRGSLGKIGINTKIQKGAIASSLVIIRAGKRLDQLYLAHFLSSPICKALIKKSDNGSSQPNLSATNLKQFQIPLPPLDTQKKIAAILDAADAYRQKTKTLIEKYDQLAQSLFLDMFGGYLYNEENELPIKKIAKFIDYRGKTPSRVANGIPLISAKCVRSGYFDNKRLDYLEEETYAKIMTRGFPRIGDVLFTTEGATMGFTCRIPEGFEKFAVGQRLITLQVKNNYDSTTLDFMLNHRLMQSRVFSKATGSAAKGIRSAEFAKLRIPVPPIALQTQFAERIQLIEAQKQQAQASLQKAEDLFNSLLQRAFKGELVG